MSVLRAIGRVAKRELGRMFVRPLYIFASVGVMVLSTFFFISIMKYGTPENIPVARDAGYVGGEYHVGNQRVR